MAVGAASAPCVDDGVIDESLEEENLAAAAAAASASLGRREVARKMSLVPRRRRKSHSTAVNGETCAPNKTSVCACVPKYVDVHSSHTHEKTAINYAYTRR